MTEWVVSVVFALLSISLVLGFIRLAVGPTLPDRVVALELIASIVMAMILIYAIQTNTADFIDVALVLALTGFLAAVGFARFLERGGSNE